MDIRAGIIAAVVMLAIGAVMIFRSGYRAFLSARKLTFYRIKHQRERGALFTILGALLVFAFAIWLFERLFTGRL